MIRILEIFSELMGGERTPQELLSRLLELGTQTFQPARRKAPGPAPPQAASSYRQAFALVLESLPRRADHLARWKSQAAEDLATLRAAPRAQRGELIERMAARCASPAVVDLLLRQVEALLDEQPGEAFELAQCAQAVALRLSSSGLEKSWALTSVARATAHLGCCLSALGDLHRADRMLEFALELFDGQGNGDVLVEAEILAMTAALRRDERRFLEAEAFFNMATGLYEECEAFDEVAPLLLQKAAVLAAAGELEQAIDTLEGAISHIDQRRQPELYVLALEDQAFYLLAADLATVAGTVLARCRQQVARQADALLAARFHWLLGRVALAEGQTAKADAALKRVAATCSPLELSAPPSYADSFARDALHLGSGKVRPLPTAYAPTGSGSRTRAANMPRE